VLTPWSSLPAQETREAWAAPPLEPLVRAVAAEVRENELDLIGTVYSTVALATVAEYLSLDEQAALAACRARGWGFDAADATVLPEPPPPDDAPEDLDGLERIKHLASIVTQLSS